MGVICYYACEGTHKEKNFPPFVYLLHLSHPLQKSKYHIPYDIFTIRERRGAESVTGEKKNARITRYRYGKFSNLSLDVFGFLWKLKNTRPFDSLACVKGGSPA